MKKLIDLIGIISLFSSSWLLIRSDIFFQDGDIASAAMFLAWAEYLLIAKIAVNVVDEGGDCDG